MTNEFENPLYQAIYDRIYKRRQNCLIACVGETGTGKSYTALQIASTLDKGFNHETVKERVVVSPEQFTDLVVNKANTLQTGSALVIDEAGAGSLQAREWHSVTNKQITYLLQVFRYQQLLVIFTVPSLDMIDKNARKLINYVVEARKINFDKGLCKCKVYRLTYDKIKAEKPYKQRFVKKDQYGEDVILDYINFSKPPTKLGNAYEKYSYAFKKEMARKNYEEIEKARELHDKQQAVFNPQDIADKILKDKDAYLKEWQGRTFVDLQKVEAKFGLGTRRAKRVKVIVEDTLTNPV